MHVGAVVRATLRGRGVPSSRPPGPLAPGLSSWRHSFCPTADVGSAKECFFCHDDLFRRVLPSGQGDRGTSVRGFAPRVGMKCTKIAFVVNRQCFQKIYHLVSSAAATTATFLPPVFTPPSTPPFLQYSWHYEFSTQGSDQWMVLGYLQKPRGELL